MAGKAKSVIRFTGQRRNRRHLVNIRGKDVWMSNALLSTLCDLLLARIRSASGFARIPRMTIYRLRKVISSATGRACDGLIETGAEDEYRLLDDMTDVRFDESFLELRDKSLVSPSDMEDLIRAYRKAHPK